MFVSNYGFFAKVACAFVDRRGIGKIRRNKHFSEKRRYLPHFYKMKFQGYRIVNRASTSPHGRSLEITRTVPLSYGKHAIIDEIKV